MPSGRELVGRASAGLAHDLRNVFVVIRGCVDEVGSGVGQAHAGLANGEPATVEVDPACLRDVSAASDRGLAIIDDLLWLGRQNDYDLRVTDVADAFRQSEPLLRRLVHKGITFTMDIPSTETLVRIDRVGLTQVMMNLVTNASDAIVGQGRIAVSTRETVTGTTGEPERTTSIIVSDTGSGFTREAMQRAFEPDFTTKDGNHGGFGLATVWRIVDRCGGAVQIDSAPGAGTTVAIRFASFTDPNRDADDQDTVEPAVREVDVDALTKAAV